MHLKNKRITIQLDDEFHMAVEEKATQANISISAYVRRCIHQSLKSPEEPPKNSGQIPAGILTEELRIKNEQIDKLQQALDQQQQLHAVSQNTVDTQRQQLEEARLQIEGFNKPKNIWQKLRTVFGS